MSDFGDVYWRLTVRDPQGELIFGPRVYLSDKTMIAAVKRWDVRDNVLTREFATRGAWQNVDATICPPSDDPWDQSPEVPKPLTQAEWEQRATEQFGPSPRDQAASAEIDAWNAMTPEERGAYLEAHRIVPKTRSPR